MFLMQLSLLILLDLLLSEEEAEVCREESGPPREFTAGLGLELPAPVVLGPHSSSPCRQRFSD